MKRSIILVLTLVCLNIYSQENTYRIKIDSLNSLKEKNSEQIAILNFKNSQLDKEINFYNFKLDSISISKSNTDILYSKIDATFYSDEKLYKMIGTIEQDTQVILLEELDEAFKVKYSNKIGYVRKNRFITDVEYQKIKIEKQKLAEEQAMRAEAEQKKRKTAEEKQRVAKEKAQEEKTNEMIKKYGTYYGKLVGKGSVVIGMTKDMVIDSFGKPRDINRSVGSWGVHEQWIYYSTYIYFENGKVTSFQD